MPLGDPNVAFAAKIGAARAQNKFIIGGGKSLANPDGRGQSDGHIPDQAT